jgi:exodeoxyribonuclease VII small subunit
VTEPDQKQSSPKRSSRKPAEPTGTASPDEQTGPAVADEFAELSYEQARDALIDVVRRLESGAETLEESLALWERGEALARHCERWLAGAQAKLDAARAPADGE